VGVPQTDEVNEQTRTPTIFGRPEVGVFAPGRSASVSGVCRRHALAASVILSKVKFEDFAHHIIDRKNCHEHFD
jgi:hypothetical protein